MTDADLDRVVDEHWDPPVTLAVRLVSVIDDATQHAGQAAYASGILSRTADRRPARPAGPDRRSVLELDDDRRVVAGTGALALLAVDRRTGDAGRERR